MDLSLKEAARWEKDPFEVEEKMGIFFFPSSRSQWGNSSLAKEQIFLCLKYFIIIQIGKREGIILNKDLKYNQYAYSRMERETM